MEFFDKLINSFRVAIYGVLHSASERSVRIHAAAALLVIIAGFYFGLAKWEWVAVVLAMGSVLGAELFNTAIEELANVVRDQNKLDRGATKLPRDIAAGAVLLLSISSAVIGLLIFLPKIIV